MDIYFTESISKIKQNNINSLYIEKVENADCIYLSRYYNYDYIINSEHLYISDNASNYAHLLNCTKKVSFNFQNNMTFTNENFCCLRDDIILILNFTFPVSDDLFQSFIAKFPNIKNVRLFYSRMCDSKIMRYINKDLEHLSINNHFNIKNIIAIFPNLKTIKYTCKIDKYDVFPLKDFVVNDTKLIQFSVGWLNYFEEKLNKKI